ncbi:MAG: hypothetical protein NTW87_11230 [Planctomycetota bacterium]|nr:hypothetical protein [Planctomycetota bacterium]
MTHELPVLRWPALHFGSAARIGRNGAIAALRRAIRKTLEDFAAEHGCTTEQAFYRLMGRENPLATGEKPAWGRLPEDYDPRSDPSHPMNAAPQRGEDR